MSTSHQIIDYRSVREDTPFATMPCPAPPFSALIIDPNGQSTRTQDALARRLVTAGCALMAAWGPDSTTWDDAGDWAALLTTDGALRTKPFDVMTVWFDDAPYVDAAEFVSNFVFDDGHNDRILVLEFGHAIGRTSALAGFTKGQDT